MRFVDLFCGLGGFHLALSALKHKCVFACDIEEDLQLLYERNFGLRVNGDIRAIEAVDVPAHDILCAGFPCQPFSKAGEQLGTECKLWGDLFSKHVYRILKEHKPRFILMENVANLERHNGGCTWSQMKLQLESLGYRVDTRILSPHRFGVPQIRERLYIVGSRDGLEGFEWPTEDTTSNVTIHSVLDKSSATSKPLSQQVTNCLDAWQDFLRRAPATVELPSFPIWAMEFGATYPFTKYDSLRIVPLRTLRQYRGSFGQTLNQHFYEDIEKRLPSYARGDRGVFPRWKQVFIRQNREFYRRNKKWIDPWLPQLRDFPSSLQKFEWNCKGEIRDLWRYVIQFRASGVRIKRPTTAPSLVAMTTTQIPIIGWERRYMTPRECCRLQSMDKLLHLPESETRVCKALGNAVNAKVVESIAKSLIGPAVMKNKRSRNRKSVA